MGAGAFMNFILAVFLFSLALMIPREVSVGQAVIAQVVPGSPAEQAGLQKGDIIEKIDGRKIESVPDASYNIHLNLGEDTEIVVRRTDPMTRRDDGRHRPRHAALGAAAVRVHGVSPARRRQRVRRHRLRPRYRAPGGRHRYALTRSQTLIFGSGENEIQYETQEGDTIAFVARQLRLTDAEVAQAAGLGDPDTLQPGDSCCSRRAPRASASRRSTRSRRSRSYGPFDGAERAGSVPGTR